MEMKNLIPVSLFTLLFCLLLNPAAQAVVSPVGALEAPVKTNKELKDLSAEDILQLDRAELEEKLGRKMKLKERMMLKITKRKMKKLSKKASNQRLEEAGTNGLAVAGFVCSIVGLLLSVWLLLAILGIVFSAIALSKIKRTGEGGRGLAMAGLIIGIVAVALGLSILALAFTFL